MTSTYQPLSQSLEDKDCSKEDIHETLKGETDLAGKEDKVNEDDNDLADKDPNAVIAHYDSHKDLDETPIEDQKIRVRSMLTKLIWTDEDIETAFDCYWHSAVNRVAHPWLRGMQLANILMLVNQVGMFGLVRWLASCTEHGQATYPLWIWSAALPFMIARLLIEYRASRSLVPAYARVVLQVKGLKLFKLGPFELGSSLWFIISFGFSASSISDMGTDSCFTGVTSVALQCPGEQASSIWNETFAQSLFGKFGLPAIDLGWVAMVFWCMSLFQMIAPLVQYISMTVNGPNSVDSSCFGDLGHPGDICEKLADGAGMATVQTLLAPTTEANIKCDEDLDGALEDHLLPMASVVVFRVWSSYVLEISLQINLQVTVFAINAYIVSKTWTHAQIQIAVSIALSMVTASTKIAEIYAFFKIVKIFNTLCNEKGDYAPHASTYNFRKFSCYLWLIRVGFAIVVLSVIYGIMKFAAVFFCEDSMWNVTGCVSMSHAAKSH